MAFAALSEEAQVAALADLARAALDAWGLGGAAVELIKYRENAVFAVRSRGGARHVLRIHRPGYRSDDHIRAEVSWMRALADDGVPTPPVIPTRSGDVLAVVASAGVPEARQCDLLGWVEGAPIGTLEQGVELDGPALHETYRTVGGIAARIHAHGEAWPKPGGFVRPAWDRDALVGDTPTFGRFWELDVLSEAQREPLLRARDRVRQRLERLGPAGALIHGDLIPDNLLVAGDAVRVIDFDDCGWSWLGFELATSLFPLLPAGLHTPALRAYREGYAAIRPFPDDELESLPDLWMARALSYLGWPVGRPEIHSQRKLAPLFASVIAGLAERYLADAL